MTARLASWLAVAALVVGVITTELVDGDADCLNPATLTAEVCP